MAPISRRHFTAALLASSQAPRLFAAQISTTSIDDVVRGSMQRRGIPNVVAMAISSKRDLYTGAFGQRDGTSGPAVTADSVFQIASMTKPITSVAAMQLVEQGKVTLDEPVSKHLPQLADPKIFEGYTISGDAILRPAKSPITLRHLLTHTSGIAYPTWHGKMAQYAAKNNVGNTVVAPVVPLMFEPGSNWQYGYSTDWAGRLVETMSGMTLQQYFRKNILDPLEMKDTEFGIPPDRFERSVTVFQRDAQGKFTARPRTQPAAPADFNGGGGLSSTANDYAKFMRMLLRHGMGGVKTEILKAKTVDEMFRNQIGGIQAGSMRSFQPNVSADVDTNPGSVDKWGLGFLLHGPGKKEERSEGSGAWAGIFNTFFWVDMKKDVAGVVMTQYLPFFDKDAVGLLGDFETAFYSQLAGTTTWRTRLHLP